MTTVKKSSSSSVGQTKIVDSASIIINNNSFHIMIAVTLTVRTSLRYPSWCFQEF